MKADNIQTTGTIIKREAGSCYRVKLASGQEIICWTANRFKVPAKYGRGMRTPKINEGDKVKIEIDPRDFSKGMLVGFVKKTR